MRVAVCEISIDSHKRKWFFPAVHLGLKDCEIITISQPNELEQHQNTMFDVVIVFSYYNDGPYKTWTYRKACTKLNYKHIVYIESPVLKDISKQSHYRVSIDNIRFCKETNLIDTAHVQTLKNKLTCKLQPYKNTGAILLLLQNPAQYFLAMTPQKYQNYINKVIANIRKYSSRPIIIRYKPGHNYHLNFVDSLKKIQISSSTLADDCKRCCICVVHSTIAVVYCVFMGLHIFSLSDHCLAQEVADTDFAELEKFNTFDRQSFVDKLLSSSLSREDFKNGKIMEWVNNFNTSV